MSLLFTPLRLREVTFRNRIVVSPMCQYSSVEGMATDWHLVHLGSRAVGGAGLVITEAAAVSPEGRISAADLGIWSDAQAERLRTITDFIKAQGAVAGIQLAHAGRKAATEAPWRGGQPLGPERGWLTLAPSGIAFAPGYALPREMTEADLAQVAGQFAEAAARACRAGFEVVELHMAHGYLLHEFLSPLTNHRHDDWGGDLENRMRFPLRVARAVRAAFPSHLPVFVRISATDWVEGGWDLPQSIRLARALEAEGCDLVVASSGGAVPDATIPAGPGFQTPFASALRQAAGIKTGALGLITDPAQAEQILATGLADMVVMARELLRDPYWPLRAARALGAGVPWPAQYRRAQLP
ncbi:MAG: NADH:flavin oxidoreductase/NADH oxidase [Betaproteobacteria bacterium]|nr:NADH:flavin oxidoreductase/NADH oxidase [Betaproteobacteria bacterium]